MSANEISAFVSCCYRDEDRRLVDWICRFARALGFAPHIADHPDTRPPQDKIRDEIQERDCVIAIATRVARLEGTDTWTTTPWVTAEIGMAYAFGKPLILFREEGVQVQGLAERITSYFEFSRDRLRDESTVIEIVEFLNKTKDDLVDLISRSSRMQTSYILDKIRRLLTLERNGSWTDERELTLVCTSDQVAELRDSTWISNSSDLPFMKPQFACDMLDSKIPREVSHEIVYQTPQHLHWVLRFDPPIERDETVVFGWQLQTGGYMATTSAVIESLTKSGTYFLPGKYCEDGVTIRHPTRHLQFEIRFPHNYRVTNPSIAVALGEDPGAIYSRAEEKRIERNDWFKSSLGRTCELEMGVENPLFGHTYLMRWIPPQTMQT